MMQSGSHCQRNSNSKGVSYKQHNSKSSKDLKTQLFNHIDRLVADHNVTVSSTMIKVTYNKGMKDHSVTSANGNECDNNRHTIAYNPSYSDSYKTKLSIGSKNNNKSFNNIVFIPKNVAVTRNNGVALVKNKFQKEYEGLINERKLYITPHKKSFKEDIQGIKNYNYNCMHNKEFQLKKLRIHLKKMNTSITQASSKSPGPVNHVIDNCPNHPNNSSSEINCNKFPKNDSHKTMNENKDPSCSSSVKMQVKKDMVKVHVSSNLDKERLKSIISKDENFKKKRPAASNESHGKSKKLKSDSDISGKVARERGSVSKVKEQKMNVNCKEKKMPVKALNSSEVVKDSSKRELLRDDPTLPPGWRRIIKGRHTAEEFKPVICIASPEGRKFYFKAKLQEYLKRTNSHLTIDDFHFGLYEKGSRERSNRKGNKKENSEGKPIVKRARKKKPESVLEVHEPKRIRLDKTNNIEDHTVKIYSAIKHQADAGVNERGAVDKNVLLVDPDLPSGWVRKVRIKNGVEGPDKFQVWVISPEGKKFRRKYLLQKYLLKTGSPLNINQFYFGLYPKKDGSGVVLTSEQSKRSYGKSKIDDNPGNISHFKGKDSEKFVNIEGKEYRLLEVEGSEDGSISDVFGAGKVSLVLTKMDSVTNASGEQPMLEDPTLPPGWRRYIKVRATGETAGRMEAILVSPDGRKHRSKGRLKNYIKENGLNLNADDFDFTVFGKHSKKDSSNATPSTTKPKPGGQIIRKRDSLLLPSDTSFPNLNLNHASLYDLSKRSRESLMINYVGGIMLNCGLRDLRSERRHRIPKEEQEKILKKYLESDAEESVNDEKEISTNWVQKLIHCRSDFGTLEGDAATTIASLTKEFLQKFARHALEMSKGENSLEYRDLADVVDKSECLSPLKTLIPKKITFREFIRLNRPTKFSSFT